MDKEKGKDPEVEVAMENITPVAQNCLPKDGGESMLTGEKNLLLPKPQTTDEGKKNI